MSDTTTEAVERLADWLRDDDLHEAAQHHVTDTLLALRAALDEAEARAEAAEAERDRLAALVKDLPGELAIISENAKINGYGSSYIVCHGCAETHEGLEAILAKMEKTDEA